jgi:hypothetical protein
MRHRTTTWVECGKRVRAVLLDEWNPSGAPLTGGSSDTFDGYALRIIGLLVKRASQSEVFDYLWRTETQTMHLSGDRERAERVAALLMAIPAEVERDLGE